MLLTLHLNIHFYLLFTETCYAETIHESNINPALENLNLYVIQCVNERVFVVLRFCHFVNLFMPPYVLRPDRDEERSAKKREEIKQRSEER